MPDDFSWFEYDGENPDAEPAPDSLDQDWQSLIASEPASIHKTAQTKEKQSMINVQRNNTPSGTDTPKGVQFLSPKHVTSPAGFDVTITKITTPDNGGKADNFGNPYVVYMTNGAEKFSKGFKPTSDLLISLVDMLGTDETKWEGRKINVNKRTDDEGGQRLVFSPVAKAKK